MAKKRNQQEPEDAGKAAADTRTEAAPPDALEPVKENPTGEPGSLKEKLLKIDGREFTIVPPEPDDPEAAAQLEELEKEFSRKFTESVKGFSAISDASKRFAEAFSNPTVEAFRQQQELLKTMLTGAQAVIEENRAIIEATRNAAIEATRGALNTAKVIRDMTGFLRFEDIAETREMFEIAAAWLQEQEELQPYLEEEIKKPEYEGKTLNELREEWEIAEPAAAAQCLFIKAVQAARAARDAARKEAEERLQLPRVQYSKGADVKTITDKLANLFFSPISPPSKGYINGQRIFTEVRYERSGKDITLFYDYLFNENILQRYGLHKTFSDQAFFVMSVIDNLRAEGNQTFSLSKLWHELGYDGTPSTDQKTEILNILRLGMSTIVTAEIGEVLDAWGVDKDEKGELKAREIESPVIPVQIINEKFVSNGKTADAMIHSTGFSPFYIIGYQIDHYTTWKKEILQDYTGRRTKRYWGVLRFLMQQIGWLRNPQSKRSNKIIYDSLYSYTGAKSTRDKQLTRDMMYRLLDECFIPNGYVSAYKEDNKGKPGVKVIVTRNPQLPTKKKRHQ